MQANLRNERQRNPNGTFLPIPVGERFWSKVEIGPQCWMWTAGTNGAGYGMFRFEGKYCYSHRMAYELLRGEIPAGLTIDHLCRNRLCCNPAHMEPVTNRVNVLRGIGPTVVRMDTRTHTETAVVTGSADSARPH